MRETETMLVHTPNGELEFPCPRCRETTRQRLYGPCGSCRTELCETLWREPSAGQATRAAIDPKMNVVPNFVATKD